MNHKRKAVIEGNEISRLVTYTLGGHEQKVLIEGRNRKAPVILFLHGGPGAPLPFSEGSRGMYPELTDKAVMVYWDQLGCGINRHKIDDRFCIEDFITMTIDLVRELKKEFPDNRLLLFGVSWGSMLAASAASRVPELIDKVLTFGQILYNVTFNDEVYGALERAGLPKRDSIKLQEIKGRAKHKTDDIKTIMNWIGKYTEGYQCKSGGRMPLLPVLIGSLKSPDYRWKDFLAVFLNSYQKNTSLLEGIVAIDLRNMISHMPLPYVILQGSTDLVTPTRMVSEFIRHCGNPNVRLRVIKDCGHLPGKEAMLILHEELYAIL